MSVSSRKDAVVYGKRRRTVLSFREIESVDFMDAVEMLAERAKLPMPEMNFDTEKVIEQKKKRDNILKVLRESAHFYLNNLNSGHADAHIQYILSRKISAPVVRKFGLGASLDFISLPQYLLDKGYSREDIIDSGAVIESEKNKRLVFDVVMPFSCSYTEEEIEAYLCAEIQKADPTCTASIWLEHDYT